MSYSENVTKNDLKEVFTQLGLGVSFGQLYKADWTASSTNSTPQRCTDSVYLPKGKYIGVIKLPITNQDSNLFFYINDTNYRVGGSVKSNQSAIPLILEVTSDNRETFVITGMSESTTYTYFERAYLSFICISDMKQYGTTVLDYYPVGAYYETSDSTFNPNDAWGGTWELKSNATLSENSEIITDTVRFTISRARVSNTSVTAPNKTGYSFLCWGPTATNGWIGGLYPEYPRQQTTKFWVETSDGTSNTGNCDATAIYIKNSETIYRWHRTA